MFTFFVSTFVKSPETDLNNYICLTNAGGIGGEGIMKKTLLTASILAATTFYTQSTFAEGVTQADEHILVTANRSQQEKFLVLSATQVISEREIEILQPQSVTDLLDKVSGISVVTNGGAGQNSTVSMRGTNSGHTLILVDGVRIGSATLGSTSLSTMSIAQIDRIEVVKGPRAALWGSDAVGGVIQIFTKQLTSGEGVVSAGFGSNNLWKADASIGLGNDKNSLTFTVATEESDGFSATDFVDQEDDDGYDRLTFGVVGKSEINNEISLHLASRWEQGGAEYDPKYGGANENEHENYHVRLAGQYQKDALFSELSLAKSQDKSSTFGNQADKQAIETVRDQLSFVSQYTLTSETSLTAGFDWYNEDVAANYDLVSWVDGEQQWDETERDVSAVFVSARHEENKFLFEGAIRHDDVEGVDSEVTYNASIGYQVSNDLLISVSHATAFKAPSFNDLYWPGSGNADLEPENVTSSEVLLRHKFDKVTFEASYFDSEIENLIAWAPNDAGAWQPSNINRAEISGFEISLTGETGAFYHQLALSFIDAEDAENDVPLARRPEFTGNYTLSYQLEKLNISSIFSYRDQSSDTTSLDSDILDSYWLLDLSANYQLNNKIRIIGKINNLFDEEYQTAKNYIADGINYSLSASYAF